MGEKRAKGYTSLSSEGFWKLSMRFHWNPALFVLWAESQFPLLSLVLQKPTFSKFSVISPDDSNIAPGLMAQKERMH